jgi:hypothetical protein
MFWKRTAAKRGEKLRWYGDKIRVGLKVNDKIFWLVFLTLSFQLFPFRSSAFAATRHLTAGEASSPFLKVPLSARAAALGEAFVAWGRDAAVVEYNPAGVAAMDGGHMTASHMLHFQDSTLSALSAAGSWKRVGLGFHYRQFAAEDVGRNATGARDGDIDHQEYALQGAVGVRVGRRWGVGAGAKIIGRRIEWSGSSSAPGGLEADGSALAWDAGMIWALPRGALGMSLQNIGRGEPLDLSGDPSVVSATRESRRALPQILRLGGAHAVGYVTFSWEAAQPRDNRVIAAAGAELRLRPWFFLRGGLRHQRFLDLSAGMGFAWQYFTFDYAYAPRADLDNLHRATIGVRF